MRLAPGQQALDGSPARPLVRYAEEQIFGLDVAPDGALFLARGSCRGTP
jgi:hypothetical protein